MENPPVLISLACGPDAIFRPYLDFTVAEFEQIKKTVKRNTSLDQSHFSDGTRPSGRASDAITVAVDSVAPAVTPCIIADYIERWE